MKKVNQTAAVTGGILGLMLDYVANYALAQ